MNKLTQKILKRQSPQPLAKQVTALMAFFRSPLGSAILADEQVAIDEALEKAFGFHLLQMSPLSQVSLYETSAVNHKFQVSFSLDNHPSASVCLDELALPFESNSVDTIILHHMLDYCLSPHDLLKEVRRIVRPGGDIIIIGFNPLSALGLIAQLKRWHGHTFWRARMLSVSRLLDWLTLLDISVQKVEYAFFRLPFNLPRIKTDTVNNSQSEQSRQLSSRVGTKLERILRDKQVSLAASSYIATAKNEYIPLTPKRKLWPSNAETLIPQVKNGYCSDTLAHKINKKL